MSKMIPRSLNHLTLFFKVNGKPRDPRDSELLDYLLRYTLASNCVDTALSPGFVEKVFSCKFGSFNPGAFHYSRSDTNTEPKLPPSNIGGEMHYRDYVTSVQPDCASLLENFVALSRRAWAFHRIAAARYRRWTGHNATSQGSMGALADCYLADGNQRRLSGTLDEYGQAMNELMDAIRACTTYATPDPPDPLFSMLQELTLVDLQRDEFGNERDTHSATAEYAMVLHRSPWVGDGGKWPSLRRALAQIQLTVWATNDKEGIALGLAAAELFYLWRDPGLNEPSKAPGLRKWINLTGEELGLSSKLLPRFLRHAKSLYGAKLADVLESLHDPRQRSAKTTSLLSEWLTLLEESADSRTFSVRNIIAPAEVFKQLDGVRYSPPGRAQVATGTLTGSSNPKQDAVFAHAAPVIVGGWSLTPDIIRTLLAAVAKTYSTFESACLKHLLLGNGYDDARRGAMMQCNDAFISDHKDVISGVIESWKNPAAREPHEYLVCDEFEWQMAPAELFRQGNKSEDVGSESREALNKGLNANNKVVRLAALSVALTRISGDVAHIYNKWKEGRTLPVTAARAVGDFLILKTSSGGPAPRHGLWKFNATDKERGKPGRPGKPQSLRPYADLTTGQDSVTWRQDNNTVQFVQYEQQMDGKLETTHAEYKVGNIAAVRLVCWSPHRVAFALDDNSVAVYDRLSTSPLQVYKHSAPVVAIACNPNASFFVSASEDGQVLLLWDSLSLRELTFSDKADLQLAHLACTEHHILLVDSQGSLRVAGSAECRFDEVKCDSNITAVTVDGKCKRFILGDSEGRILEYEPMKSVGELWAVPEPRNAKPAVVALTLARRGDNVDVVWSDVGGAAYCQGVTRGPRWMIPEIREDFRDPQEFLQWMLQKKSSMAPL